jgi:hypothetical protein
VVARRDERRSKTLQKKQKQKQKHQTDWPIPYLPSLPNFSQQTGLEFPQQEKKKKKNVAADSIG